MSGPTDPGQSHGVGARARVDQAALDSRNLFSLDTTVLDLRRLGPADLEHRYGSSPAELSMYERVTRLVSGLEQSYAVEHGAAAPNPMECTPDEAALLRGWYAGKSEYLEALELLGIPAGVVGGQLRRPWWNRVTCAERGYAAGEEGALLELVPRHS